MTIDREIEKVRHDMILASKLSNPIRVQSLAARLDALYLEKHALQIEEDTVLSRFEAEHKPKARRVEWWDRIGAQPAGDTTLKDGQWEEAGR